MIEKAKPHCKQLLFKDHISYEVGGDLSPTIIPNAIPNCEIDILANPTGMDWAKCKQTPFEGQCWQYAYSSMTPEEWGNFIKQRRQGLKGK